jgi:PadR family transcriptional regulator PadR
VAAQADLLRGTLDVPILNTLSLGPRRHDGVLLRIEQTTGGALTIEQAATYPGRRLR